MIDLLIVQSPEMKIPYLLLGNPKYQVGIRFRRVLFNSKRKIMRYKVFC